MRSLRSPSMALALLLAAAAPAGVDVLAPRESWASKPKPPEPRRFTDARKAEAEAKRQRKAAKRAKAVRHD